MGEDAAMMRHAMRSDWGRVATAILGALIYALGLNLFVVPLGLITGGMMGFCQLLRYVVMGLLGLKSMPFDFAGVIFYALNVPILLLAYRTLGRVFFRNTLICASAYSLFVSIVPVPSTPIVEDMLTGCLLGGVISGVGTGLALTSGCCGGGLDALGLYLSKKGVPITMGRFNLGFNLVLSVLCAVMFDLPTLIYSVLNIIFSSIAIDRAHSQSVNVQVLIFTKADPNQLIRYVMENLHRGITRWEGQGVYTGEATHILCVCVNKYEIGDLREALHKTDPKAFFIVQEGVHLSENFERRLS